MPSCKQCKNQFEITNEDRAFYKKMDVPEPTLCVACAHQRRFAFRNDKVLYPDTCALCKKNIISMYHPSAPYVVYCPECINSDGWDPLTYGKSFDFTRTFFEQYDELSKRVPRTACMRIQTVNSDYSNYVGFLKNCYLCFAGNHSEDCLYSYLAERCKNCVDCAFTFDSEYCYETIGVRNCFECQYTYDSQNCSHSVFLKDCRDCMDCFMCCNLVGGKYCFMNEKLGSEEYKQKAAAFRAKPRAEQIVFFKEYITRFPKRCNYNYQSEDCTGEYIMKSKNCTLCYQMDECENTHAVDTGFSHLKDSQRVCYSGDNSSLFYETLGSGVDSYNLKFCIVCFSKCFNLTYCDFCSYSSDCFGCINLKHKQYCILNKQYTREEYQALMPRIIDHMKKTGEWGEFFTPALSQYGYNETYASEFKPLTKEEARAAGFTWQDDMPGTFGKETVAWDHVPTSAENADESLCKEVLACEKTGKNFKIIKQELAFYKKFGIEIPRLHPEVRHAERMLWRSTRVMFQRQCMCDLVGHEHTGRCAQEFETTYAPERPEKVYCEGCYQKEVN